MNIEISGIHIEVTKRIDDFIHKKMKKVNKYLKDVTNSRVILKSEKNRYETEINILTKGSVINAKEVGNDLFASIEGAIKKVVNQSKKYKEKKRSHKVSASRKFLREKEEISKKSNERPVLERVTKELAKPLEVEEAVMQLESSGDDFLVFLNAKTNQINVICKKEDGGFTLIEPS